MTSFRIFDRINSNVLLVDQSDSNSAFSFDVSNITTPRTLTLVDGSTTLVGTNLTQTLTNKTFNDSTTIFQDNSDNTKQLQFQLASITTSTTRTLTIPDANTTIVGIDVSQILTNKSIDSDNNTITNIDNNAIKAAAAIDATKIADGSISNTEFQQLNGITSSVVGISDTQTLTNKSIDADNNTITNIDNNAIKASAAIDATKIANGSISNTEFQQLNGITSSVVGISDTQTLTNKTFVDASTTFQDNSDNTKQMQFQLSSITTSTTRTITIPDADTTLVGIATNQTLTNKTFGDDLDMNSNKIINVATPTNDNDVVNKVYVDNIATGLDVKKSVVAATTGSDLNFNGTIDGATSYDNNGGASGTGQITGTLDTSNTFILDGVTFSSTENGARILVKDQSDADENGIWTITISGTSLTLNRANDFDENSKVTAGAFTFVEEGTTNANSGWVLTSNDPITVGNVFGSDINFAQFSGGGSISAGNGLTKTGSTLNVGGSTTIIANADTIEVNSSNTMNEILLSSGTAGTAATFGALPLGNSNAVTGTLGIANGGTNTTSFAAGSRLISTNSGNTALETTSINVSDIITATTATTTTNDDTSTQLSTLATSTDTTYLVEALIIADNTSSAESAGFVLYGLFRNDGGTLVKVSDDQLILQDSITWTANIIIDPSMTTNISIYVQGLAATTINWKVSYRVISV